MNNKIKIRLQVKHKDSLIKELVNKKIPLYDIAQNKDYLELIINKADLAEIKKIKTIKKINIINYYGVSKILYLLKNNYLLVIFIIMGIMINILLSNLILKIDIKTNNPTLQKMVLEDLEEYGIHKYSIKLSYQEKESLKTKLKEKEINKIEWLEIEEKGTNFIITIEEKKEKEQDTICTPKNIVASKKGVITKIEAADGEIIKKVNDYVEENDVVISGLIYNKDKIVSKKCASGKIYGETWYKVIISIPSSKKIIKKTGNKKNSICINIGKKSIILPSKYKKYQRNAYNIIDSNIVPLKFGLCTLEEEIIYQEKYTTKELDNIVDNFTIKKLKQENNNIENIISKKVLKKTLKNSKIIIEVFVSVEEEISKEETIENINIDELNKEKE